MCTSQIYTTQVQVLGYSTKAQTQLACVLCLRFVPFPCLRSSGNQVLGEHTLPRRGASYHVPSPSRSLPGSAAASQVCRMSLLER